MLTKQTGLGRASQAERIKRKGQARALGGLQAWLRWQVRVEGGSSIKYPDC